MNLSTVIGYIFGQETIYENMSKWQKDTKEFVVSINYNETRGTQCNIPKPILEFLGKPEKLKFIIGTKFVKIRQVQ